MYSVSTTAIHECTEDEIENLFKKAKNYNTNRLSHNYVRVPKDFLAVTIIKNYDDIMGFSFLQERDIFNGMARLCSRFFFPAVTSNSLQNLNFKISEGARLEVFEMIDQQVDFGLKLGIENFFISREDPNNKNMNRIFNGLKKYSKYEWKLSNKKFRVVNDEFQWIVWTGDNYLDPQI